MPASLTHIGEFAFGECSSLTSVAMPASLTHIGESAFYGCLSLTSVAMPDSAVTHIGKYAFGGCSSLHADIVAFVCVCKVWRGSLRRRRRNGFFCSYEIEILPQIAVRYNHVIAMVSINK
eukprot:SAG31_NODE_3976_length_3702_cov_6.141549_1_plen_120_part_00